MKTNQNVRWQWGLAEEDSLKVVLEQLVLHKTVSHRTQTCLLVISYYSRSRTNARKRGKEVVPGVPRASRADRVLARTPAAARAPPAGRPRVLEQVLHERRELSPLLHLRIEQETQDGGS